MQFWSVTTMTSRLTNTNRLIRRTIPAGIGVARLNFSHVGRIPVVFRSKNSSGRIFDLAPGQTQKDKTHPSNQMNQYHKLYTAEDSVVVFIDHQPQMMFGVASIDRATLINNVTLLGKVAKEFKVPAIVTAVETESFSGYVWPQLLDVFPGRPVVERSSMNAWDDAGFRKSIEATGRKNILLTGLWTEVCVTS